MQSLTIVNEARWIRYLAPVENGSGLLLYHLRRDVWLLYGVSDRLLAVGQSSHFLYGRYAPSH
jgi:hypothetical protein